MEKRAQQMTLGTIILIVLGIAVLVFLIYGFSSGWNNLWDNITNYGGGKVNYDTIERSCTLACTQESVDGFCRTDRVVKYGEPIKAWSDVTNNSDTLVKESKATCDEFSQAPNNFGKLKVDPCLKVTCA